MLFVPIDSMCYKPYSIVASESTPRHTPQFIPVPTIPRPEEVEKRCAIYMCRAGNTETIKVLIHEGEAHHSYHSALQDAVRYGHVECADAIDPAVTPAYRDNIVMDLHMDHGSSGFVALSSAAQTGNIATVTPAYRDNIVMDLHMDHGSSGFVALSSAAQTGNVATVKLLLDRGITDTDSYACVWAARYGEMSLLRLFIDRLTDLDMASALVGAIEFSSRKLGVWGAPPECNDVDTNDVDNIRFLLGHGADPPRALCKAALGGHVAVIMILLDAVADPNVTGEFLETPLTEALGYQHSTTVRLLLDRGAIVDKSLVKLAVRLTKKLK
ncbi:ankyrin repeat-containing domain protein [Powellomyces hirtus]|nr:ankyrin repeat-containing domain protein [Powellomyces hirtus]